MAIQTGYNKPDVTIIQQVVNPAVPLTEPSLFPCIVGPAYRIVEDASAGSYDGTGTALDLPQLVSTDTLDSASLVVKVIKGDNTNTLDAADYTADATSVTLDNDLSITRTLEDAIGSTGDSTAGEAVFTDSSAKFITWGLEPGDKIQISSGLDSGEHEILTVDSETQVTLTAALTATQSSLDYYGKHVDSLGAGLGSTVWMSYRALRADLTDVMTFESLEDASSTLGVLSSVDNPLGFGLYIAFQNGNTQVKALAVDSTSASSYVSAFETLESEDVYAIAPLSQSTSVLSALKSHVESMSDPDEKKERIGFCNIQLPLRSIALETTDATITLDSGDIYLVNRPGAQFLSSGVVNGNMVYLESVTQYETAPATGYIVRTVVSEDSIKVQSATDITGVEAIITVASQDYTKLQRAQAIRDFASSVESKRIVISWPDQIKVTPADVELTVPGYYLNCALVAAVAALPAQQGFTRLRVSGVSNLVHSNIGYFTNTQLDTIASGGVMVLTQQTVNAIPQVRHQLTTDMNAIEYRELSIVKNVDFIARFLRERLLPYIGSWNIHDFFMSALKITLQSCFEELKLNDDLSGPNITTASIVSIEQNETNPDRVDVIVDLGIPYPANDIRVTLRI